MLLCQHGDTTKKHIASASRGYDFSVALELFSKLGKTVASANDYLNYGV